MFEIDFDISSICHQGSLPNSWSRSVALLADFLHFLLVVLVTKD